MSDSRLCSHIVGNDLSLNCLQKLMNSLQTTGGQRVESGEEIVPLDVRKLFS